MGPSVGRRFPLYPPGAAGLGWPFIFGQGRPAFPPQVSSLKLAISLVIDICSCKLAIFLLLDVETVL